MKKIRNLRWWIVGLVFLASVLNYIDRQALSILAPTVQKSSASPTGLRAGREPVPRRLHDLLHRFRARGR